MGLHNLDKIFEPRSVAVIGASEREGSIGYALMRNLIQAGYDGRLVPVNPRYSTIHGLEAYPSVAEVDHRVDLAVIAVHISTVPNIVKECVEAGVSGAIIISAGGRETGEDGRQLEDSIKKEAEKGGLRVIGPNCLGVICPGRLLNASFAAHTPSRGKLAFISQSGAICTAILDLSLRERIGFSHFVSIGSMLDVDFGDLIDYLGNDYEVKSILLYIESLTNFRKFMSAARAVSRIKPIVVLKAGRSAAGARAASSHTGAMAGEDAVYDAAFRRAGIVRVNTIGELFDCAELMAKQPRPAGHRLAIITNAGGPGVMAADALAQYGLEPAPLQSDTVKQLDQVLPSWWSRANPVDVLGDASPQRYATTVQICLKAKEFDGALVILAPQAMTDPTGVAERLTEILKGRSQPVFTAWMGGVDVSRGRGILNQAGVPTYDTPEQAIRAFMYMYEYSRNMELLQEIPPKLSRSLSFDRGGARRIIEMALQGKEGSLTEAEARALFTAYRIPVTPTVVVTSAEEAVERAPSLGYPLVMKIHSREILHKTEADGVQLDLRNETDLRTAYGRIMEGARAYKPQAEILGVTLQPMVERTDFEIMLGAKRDANFGPVILFGTGGVLAEILKDRAIGLPPLNRALARRLMERTQVYSLLVGYRGKRQADLELLEEMIIGLSQMVVDFPDIQELDMNPVTLVGGKALVLDARVILQPSSLPSPHHLVISPYPEQYEARATTAGGLSIFVRPIKPEDADAFVDLFNTLSATSIYYRFFSPLKSLSPMMLARFTQIDYDRQIALVALEDSGEDGRMLGVARVMVHPDGKEAEFSVLVGEPWHGKGVGAELLQRILTICRERGIENVWGAVLRENTQMLALGRKLGFTLKSPEPGEFLLTIDLSSLHSTH
jgi:acetyltransferase